MNTELKLFLVHCGYYDRDLCDGVYEFHINLPVVAESFEEAKKRVRENPEFQKKKMHVDGLQEMKLVNGYRIRLEKDAERPFDTVLISNRHRDLGE